MKTTITSTVKSLSLNNHETSSINWSCLLQTSDSIYSINKSNQTVWTNESISLNSPNSSVLLQNRVASQPFYFASCVWTPDGSSLITTSSDNILRLFVAPPDLLSSPQKQQFLPYSRIPFPSSITASAIYPKFKLSDYSPCLVLVSTGDHPIKLYNVHSKQSVASFPSVNPHSEVYDNPLALEFTNTDMFLAGTSGQRGKVSLFSLLRPGTSAESSGPFSSAFIPQSVAPGFKKSLVSAIAIKPNTLDSQTSLIAAVGFYQARSFDGKCDGVGLYDFRVNSDQGKCVMVSPDSFDSMPDWQRSVSGTTKLLWNQPGNHSGSDSLLFQIPRNGVSNCIVRDARMGLQQIGSLIGSDSSSRSGVAKPTATQQRLGADWIRRPMNKISEDFNGISESEAANVTDQFELVVGTSQGYLYSYKNPAFLEETDVAIYQIGAKNSSIGGVSWNPAVTADNTELVATCSGNRPRGPSTTELKIWQLKSSINTTHLPK